MEFVNNFAKSHPKEAKWIREGGLFIIFSYVVTFLKYLMLIDIRLRLGIKYSNYNVF